MISLATTSTSNRTLPDIGEAKLTSAPAQGAKGGFSAVLAKQDAEPAAKPAKAKDSEAEAATAEAKPEAETPGVLPVGIALPEAAESGKILPVLLPAIAADGETDAAEPEIENDETPVSTEAALALVAVPQLAVPATPVPAEAEAAEAASAAAQPAIPSAAVAAQAVAPVAAEPQVKGEKAAETARTGEVAIQAGPAPVAQPQAEASTDLGADADSPGDAPAPHVRETADRGALRFAAETARQAEPAIVSAPAISSSAPAAPANIIAQPMQVDTLSELTRMVDRLAAAREVFAPAAEALSIEHAEFGELSLRFDQRRDGSLSVQVSASNPDAHRAVAQAVSAQAFNSAADDRGSQPQAQNQSQGQNGSATRGGTAEREGAGGNGGFARHEQQAAQQQQPQQRQAAAQKSAGDRSRTGVFA